MKRSKGSARKAGSKPRTGKKRRSDALRVLPGSRTDSSLVEESAESIAAFPIVGIGSSAGGVEALSAILDPIPKDVDMCFVVVPHLAPHRESFLPSVLAAATRLPVAHAERDTRLEPGHVYVVPPGQFIELADGHLRLTKRPVDRRQFTPINHFFGSLAQFGQGRAIGVVLSGNASDGALGLKDIKAAGGITMAQDPATARFDSMPRAAIASGVDFVLTPPLLAEELIRIASHPVLKRATDARARRARPDGTKTHLEKIFQLLRESGGVDFSNYKTPTVLRRLHRQMVLQRITTIAEYAEFLSNSPAEVLRLGQNILIHVTRFFRDPDAFEALGKQVAPILEKRANNDPIRVWVPGCSTGEEAYSVAMVLTEQIGTDRQRYPIQVFGTDASSEAVDRARRGVYPDAIEADVSPERLRRFFAKVDDSYRVSQAVRDLCIFARQDVTHDPPFSRLDLIVCRNLLIYLDVTLQKRILGLFYYALKPHGLLMLGPAETSSSQSDYFEPLDKKVRLFKKNPGKSAHPRFAAGEPFQRAERGRREVEVRPGAKVEKDADRILLAKYTPPAVLLDDELLIRQVRGQVGNYLAPGQGSASLSVFKMARPGLAAGLRAVLERARATQKPARKEGIRVKTNSHNEIVSVEALPIRGADETQHFLILFEPSSPKVVTRKSGAAKAQLIRNPKRVRELEDELEGTRNELQTIIQDLEAANEELQSANEEILSSNEELQSTNEELDTAREELQSTNEEIITVNEELHGRNEDLARVNSDLINLLGSVQIAIVMVDGELRIRRFTPVAEKIFNLIPTDIGRPISHIKPNIECPMLADLIAEARDKVMVQQREIQDLQGKWYSLKIRPYKNVDNRIDGAVIVLVDIDTLKRQQAGTLAVDAVVDVSHEAVVVLDHSYSITHASWEFCKMFDVDRSTIMGRSLFDIAKGDWNVATLRERLVSLLTDRTALQGHQIELEAGGARRRFSINARRLDLHDGEGDRILLAIEGPRLERGPL